MKVYKFGGASVKSAEGIRNVEHILSMTDVPLFVIISAMGKTTNAMEVVLDHFMNHQTTEAINKWAEVESYHCRLRPNSQKISYGDLTFCDPYLTK